MNDEHLNVHEDERVNVLNYLTLWTTGSNKIQNYEESIGKSKVS